MVLLKVYWSVSFTCLTIKEGQWHGKFLKLTHIAWLRNNETFIKINTNHEYKPHFLTCELELQSNDGC